MEVPESPTPLRRGCSRPGRVTLCCLGDAAEEPSPLWRRILKSQQYRATPLATEPNALNQTQQDLQAGSGDTDHRVPT